MKYVFHPEALTEYSEAVQYYAQQNINLGQKFIDEVESAVYRLRDSPKLYPTIDGDIRRCLTHKFPYAILYTIESDFILILAVMHCKQKPNYWKSRRQ
ncbi:plasmid stabilization system protein [Xenococcus sp. PCC 7305]|uniref:type II toxin-antitoxin system RelE/ParE family toxin n=1 Tax=Xenococcus sp. PCC 7305 TaxID=102125 RepID=UPI0002AC69A8|nr:type II toxin-antitoxin system RelE/ParE family toxin [Xenococcus sp. PCC 7305]ELS01037.1 plasmid stabilization system protein [Xenococcus sp. PCC 7305]